MKIFKWFHKTKIHFKGLIQQEERGVWRQNVLSRTFIYLEKVFCGQKILNCWQKKTWSSSSFDYKIPGGVWRHKSLLQAICFCSKTRGMLLVLKLGGLLLATKYMEVFYWIQKICSFFFVVEDLKIFYLLQNTCRYGGL